MKNWIILLSLVVLMGSCGKDDDPEFTSAEGTWTYTTPDGKIGVDFDLKQDGTTWTVINEVIRVEGQTYKAAVVTSGIAPPDIESISINANDKTATYGYFILFANATVSEDFKEIRVPGVTYTWPHNKTNQLTDVTITRK